MPVFRNYNPQKSGKVNAQAHPNSSTYPWVPQRTSLRVSQVKPGWTEKVQPNERGRTFTGSQLSIGAKMGSGCGASSSSCNCGNGSAPTSSTKSTKMGGGV